MKLKFLNACLIILLASCVDMVQFDISTPSEYGISVYGFISNQPGPYRVEVYSIFDIKSIKNLKAGVVVNRLTLSDNAGETEDLTMVNDGIYETSAGGIQGKTGNVYKLKIELLDGRVYESIPDTLLAAGNLDSLYYSFNKVANNNDSYDYGFDVFFNASVGSSNSSRFLWKMKGTFKAETSPYYAKGCFMRPSGTCNFRPLCTGQNNISPPYEPSKVYETIGPCTCCTCWYDIFNPSPVLSDNSFTTSKNIANVKIDRIPLTGWIFMHKIRIEVSQMTLSYNAFRFYKSIRDQKNAVDNLFQPVSGKIPTNFIQISGNPLEVQGLFHAVGVDSRSTYIRREDVPNADLIPIAGGGGVVCTDLFPNSTTQQPAFWIE
jgi:hypothetical protein